MIHDPERKQLSSSASAPQQGRWARFGARHAFKTPRFLESWLQNQGLTRREDTLCWDRPRVVYHRKNYYVLRPLGPWSFYFSLGPLGFEGAQHRQTLRPSSSRDPQQICSPRLCVSRGAVRGCVHTTLHTVYLHRVCSRVVTYPVAKAQFSPQSYLRLETYGRPMPRALCIWWS